MRKTILALLIGSAAFAGDLFKDDVDVLWPLMDEMRAETKAYLEEKARAEALAV